MSVLTKSNLTFTPSENGSALLAEQKALIVDRVGICSSNSSCFFVDSVSQTRSQNLAVSFDSEFLTAFNVQKIQLLNDNVLLGEVTMIIDDKPADLYVMRKDCVYVSGLIIDFIEGEHVLTVNYYKGKTTHHQCPSSHAPSCPPGDGGNVIESPVLDKLWDLWAVRQAKELISDNTPNSITLGSDDKLLVSPSFNNQTYLTQSDW